MTPPRADLGYVDTEVTERPVDDAPPAPPTDHGDQGMVISWQAGRNGTNAATKPAADRDSQPDPERPTRRGRRQERKQLRAERRAAKRHVEPLFPEFAEMDLDSIDLSGPPRHEAPSIELTVPEPPEPKPVTTPEEEAPAKPQVAKPQVAKPRMAKPLVAKPKVARPRGAKPKPLPVEESPPEPAPVVEVAASPVEDTVPDPVAVEPEARTAEEAPEPEPVTEVEQPAAAKPRVSKPKVAKPKLSVPPPKVKQPVPAPAPHSVAPEHPSDRQLASKRFSLSRVLAAVFVGSVLAASVMVALVAAPDLLRDRSGGPNVPTLSVRGERPVPTSRHFSVTVSNVSDHPIVAACTASVTNPAGTREVAKARFAVGPIPSDATASYEGQLRWVTGKAKMAPGISVGCNERSA